MEFWGELVGKIRHMAFKISIMKKAMMMVKLKDYFLRKN